ncbi:DUF6726 family protein [Sulfurovum sp. AR]|uniref:DUF6726 family protein n=1 Tax=Sulfurovum sp. AR TaxID=1165841 RepID=UPI00025C4A8C|nr:DUF6726 family protein [Sulfurovum sp. AR]EIF50919.1 hypothetical protein SULAR_06108 [Sulfurovum sp. AR]
MPSFKQSTLYLFITLLFLSGCTQVVTAPISVAGSVVGTTLDVAGGTVGVITGSDDEDDEED